MRLRAADTSPNPSADLNTSLVGATVRFRMMHLDGTFHLNQPAVVDDAAQGLVHYVWQAGNTATPGAYLCSWVVTYGSGLVQTFSAGSFGEVLIGEVVPAA